MKVEELAKKMFIAAWKSKVHLANTGLEPDINNEVDDPDTNYLIFWDKLPSFEKDSWVAAAECAIDCLVKHKTC